MNINSGKKVSAQKIVIYGVEGIGKSEMASHFPSPVFIDTEASTSHMDVHRTDAPTSWPMLMEQIVWFSNPNNHNYKTLIVDTIDWAEKLCARFVCANGNVNGIEDFGFGKGFNYLAEEMGRMLDLLSNVVNSGTNVILLGHAHIRTLTLPEDSGNFDKYELRLQKKVAPLPKEWADAVVFCNYKTLLSGEGSKKKATGGRRVIFTNHKSAYDAKNRYGLPQEIDFEGDAGKLYSVLQPHIPIRGDVEIQQAPAVQGNGQAAELQQYLEKRNEQPQKEHEAQAPQEEQKQLEAEETQAGQQATQGNSSFSGPLYDLMNQSQVTEAEIEGLAVRSGHFPEGKSLGSFPQDYLDHIVSQWESVLKSIKQNRGQ